MISPLTLRPLLQLPFARDRYAAVLEDILPSGTRQLLQAPQPILAACDDVKATWQVGNIELPDGNTIGLLEVEVANQVKLARNRVALRNFVSRFIDEAETNAVLAVFHQPGKPDWRLTYACKRSQMDDDTLEITSTQTAPRRYTFLLGQNEPCKTAAGRLAELREKGEHLKLEDIEKAFSVERLNKDFFKQYKEHYERFVDHLLAPENAKVTRGAFGIATCKDKAEQDKADKPVRDFVKRLLGRLVFLHFLQKKGWMGCKAGGKAWTDGDADFLASYFALAESKKQADLFHSRWLIPLFFDALNNAERPGDLFAPNGIAGTRIPYLNGGLFETDPASLHALDFPAEHFRALLDFFGQYHFTIDENDPEDHEVGIDPEMLGHIFENLLEDNKDKGAYYTPKAIVAYMARQSLLHYLQTHLGENAELSVLLNEKDFTRLEKNGFVHQNAKRIAELLDAVKICDPAIGSGAFPIGLLQEILWTRLALNLELNTPEERAKLKRRIIQNSIHGVDLDPGAVEIARLRFWLALVVDEDQPRPLPNLDYKIHRADSLIEYIRGEPVRLDKEPPNNARFIAARDHLITAKHKLFSAQRVPEKREARFHLYRSLAELGEEVFTWMKLETDFTNGERLASLTATAREFHHRLVLIDKAAKQTAKTQDQILKELRAWFDSESDPTFLWQLHFGEVYAQGGFDIVIANPPYVRQEAITHIKPMLKDRFKCFKGTADLFVYFYELAAKLLKPKGTLTFITSNKFHRAAYGDKLRHFLSHSLTLRNLIDFGDKPIFEAIAYASITIGTKIAPPIHGGPIAYTWKENDHLAKLSQIISEHGFFVNQSKLTEEGWRIEKPEVLELLAKIRSAGPSLKKTVGAQSYRGVTTGLNEAFVISAEKKQELVLEDPSSARLIKPFFRGKDIKRWMAESADLFLIFTRQGTNIEDFPAIKKHLAQFKIQLEPEPPSRRSTTKWPGRKAGNYKWFEIQDQTTYWPELEKRKIISTKVSIAPTFMIDDSSSYLGNTSYCIAINDQQTYIVSILNSLVSFFYCKKIFLDKESGWFEVQPDGLEAFPVPPANAADKARLSQLAEACAEAAQRGDDETLTVHETEIDDIVYRLFDLTEEEIALIETALAPTRRATPARKRARVAAAVPASEASDAKSYKLPAAPVERRVQETPPPAWLPGELFNVEGELPTAKKAGAAPEAAATPKPAARNARTAPEAKPEPSVPVDETERADVLALIRETFTTGGERDRETALREISQALGYERLGSRIREMLNRDIRTAVRRGILQNHETQLSLLCRSVQDYERSFLKELFLAAISQNGRVWLERDEAIRRFARWLGFRRTGRVIDESARSLIKGLLREGSLEKDSQDRIRRA